MRVQDPVCGMRFDDERAVARIEQDGAAYFFCSARCLAQFAREPARFTAPESAPVPATVAEPDVSAAPSRSRRGRRCPYCGEKTAVAAGAGTAVGRLELGELEVIIRGEWRRRLGRDAYTRQHSPELIRALLASALEPGDREASAAADRAVAQELKRLRENGLSADALWQELTELSHAAWGVLSRSRASLETVVALMERIDRKLLATLEAAPYHPEGMSPAAVAS